MFFRLRRSFIPLSFLTIGNAALFAQTSVLTYHNDNMRTGQNLTETILTPQNVQSTTFGKLFTLPVDGKVDAQPLLVSGLTIPGKGAHNVVFVATEHDSLFAFDADSGVLYWQVSLLKSGETSSDDRGCGQVVPEIGITGTPVIDPTAGPNGTIYVVAMSKDSTGAYHQRLHAVNVATGAEQFSGPVDVVASYPGTGDNSSNGSVVFDPKQYKSRPGLLLVNGVVYTSWGSHCDSRPYTGWVIGYNEATLARTSVFNFAPNGEGTAVWGAGGGSAADANGILYFQLANGTFDATLNGTGFPNQADYGNAFVKLSTANGAPSVLDYWTMYNTVSESNADEDLGSGGVLLIPDVVDSSGRTRHLGTGVGKDGDVYMFDRDNMGKFDPSNNGNLYQEIASGLGGSEYASPAWFNGSIYFGAVGDVIRAFKMTAAMLGTSPASTSQNSFPFPGTTPSISADGASNGILWSVENSSPAVLYAYDPNNLASVLYNSNQAASNRDQFGNGNKFITPMIANGKVYVGTQNSVAVFGLLANSTSVTGLQCNLNSVGGGNLGMPSLSSTSCTVTVAPAPSSAQSIALASNSANLNVPASVTVSAGATTAIFTATAGQIPHGESVSLTATGGASKTLTFFLFDALSSVTCNPSSVAPGGSTTCTVTFAQAEQSETAAGLSSSSGSITVPATVTAPANSASTTFTASVAANANSQQATITANRDGSTATATISITAASGSPTLTGLQCNLASIGGGNSGMPSVSSTSCTVTLSAAPTSAQSIALASNSPNLTVPASVTVAAGATTGTFTATSGQIPHGESVTVTATSGVSKTLTFFLFDALSSLTCPSTVAAGGTITCTVTFAQAEQSETEAGLSSSSGAITLPATVSAAANTASVTFNATVAANAIAQQVTITASRDSSTATAIVSITASGQ